MLFFLDDIRFPWPWWSRPRSFYFPARNIFKVSRRKQSAQIVLHVLYTIRSHLWKTHALKNSILSVLGNSSVGERLQSELLLCCFDDGCWPPSFRVITFFRGQDWKGGLQARRRGPRGRSKSDTWRDGTHTIVKHTWYPNDVGWFLCCRAQSTIHFE